MQIATQRAFLALVCLQALHSVEEYAFRLYDVFAPARFASGLVSSNLAVGFAVLNASFVAFGIWWYFVVVRPGRSYAAGVAWVWVLIELWNGIGHPAIAAYRGSYFPGVATAPFLLVLAMYLGVRLSREGSAAARG